MKKTMMMGVVLAGALSAFAGLDNVAITFSTPGPDKYRDGRTVLDGECYALVWTPTGKTFGGIAADGKAVAPSKVVLKAPVAKDGHCPNILFEIDQDYARDNYPGGSWRVVLLDTRKFVTDADGVVQTGEDGLPKVASWGAGSSVVNGYGETGATVSGTLGSANAAGAVASGMGALMPEGLAMARISDIQVVGENVYITVKGSTPSILYGLKAGETPDALVGDGESRYGKTDGEMIIVRPKTSAAGFYSVERR